MKKKVFKIFMLAFCIALSVAPYIKCGGAAAASSETQSVEKELEENINKQLESIDTTLFDKFIYSLNGSSYKIFGASTFLEKLKSILTGNTTTDYGSVFAIICELFFAEAVKLLPLLASITAISILANILGMAKPDNQNTARIVHFVCYLAIVLIVLNMIYQLLKSILNALTIMNELMSLIFPVILTLMAASGSAVSSGVYQPAVALLCGSATTLITNIIIPLFIASIVLSVVSNLTDNIKVSKFADFFESAGNWITGILFTVFLAFLSIQGITASTHDSVSIRAVKYAISNSIPIVGGYMKEGFDLVLGSTVLIKNAVGVTGLVLLLAYIITPVLNMLVCSLGLRLTAAVCEPLSDAKVPAFLHSSSKSFSLLLAAFISLSFMFFITVMLLLMTSNSVLA